MGLFRLAARHGPLCLVLGLLAGLLLPSVAQTLKPWLGEMIAVLLFLTALRIGARAAWGGLGDQRRSLGLIAVLQLVAPLAAIAVFSLAGVMASPFFLAVVLMLAAPSLSGSPNLAIMMGVEPSAILRLLVLGTALFPLTAIPVLWLLPATGGSGEALLAALRLIAVIVASVGAGFLLRRIGLPDLSDDQRAALDGMSTIVLAIVVVGLMSAIGPLARSDPMRLLGWLVAVMGTNLGLQFATLLLARRFGVPEASALSIVSGNRNIALFLIALPAQVMDPLLIFIGCYQVPMYLTPLLMRRFHRAARP